MSPKGEGQSPFFNGAIDKTLHLALYGACHWSYRDVPQAFTVTRIYAKDSAMAIVPNDISDVIEADRKSVWHHLTQHKPFESIDPRVMVEGKGMRV